MLGIYCRISRDDDENQSIKNQKSQGVQQAKELGMEYRFYIDEGISAYDSDFSKREAFGLLLSDIEDGKIIALFAIAQDRLERNPRTREILLSMLIEHNVRFFIKADGGEVDLKDPNQTFLGDMKSIMNKYYVTITKIKISNVLKNKVALGYAHGVPPYGYFSDQEGLLKIQPDEASIVKLIFSESLRGIGTRTIAKKLNDTGVLTRSQQMAKGSIKIRDPLTNEVKENNRSEIKWAPNTVLNIIKNQVYAGNRLFSGNEYTCPAILELDYWKQVNANLNNNRTNTGKKVEHKYLLKGIMKCSVCHRNFYGRTRKNKKDHYYMCSSKRESGGSCGNRSINIDKIENFIWFALFYNRHLEHKLAEETPNLEKELTKINKEIAFETENLGVLSQRITKFLDLYGDDKIPHDKLISSIDSSQSKINSTENRISLLKNEKGVLETNLVKDFSKKGTFKSLSSNTSFSQKKELVQKHIKSIYVHYIDNIPNPHYRIKINYKHGLSPELWKTLNKLSPYFFRTSDHNGNLRLHVACPHPLDNPEDTKLWDDYVKNDHWLFPKKKE